MEAESRSADRIVAAMPELTDDVLARMIMAQHYPTSSGIDVFEALISLARRDYSGHKSGDPHTQTGRTTRMMAAALKTAEAGENVLVVLVHREHCAQLKTQYGHVENLQFVTWDEADKMPGTLVPVSSFFDHAAVEVRYRTVLALLHAWDLPAGADHD